VHETNVRFSPFTAVAAKRILILTSGPLCRNPRPLKEALTLAAAGYRVRVLNVFEGQAASEMDIALLRGTSVELETVDQPTTGAARFLRRLQTWAARKAVRHFGYQSSATLGPVHTLYSRARSHAASLTIVHNEAPLWAGRKLMRDGRNVAADFEDCYSERFPLPVAHRHEDAKTCNAELQTHWQRDAEGNGSADHHRYESTWRNQLIPFQHRLVQRVARSVRQHRVTASLRHLCETGGWTDRVKAAAC